MKIEIKETQNKRIDSYLKEELDISRTKIKEMIKSCKILVNNKMTSSSYLIKANDIIDIDTEKETQIDISPTKMELDIVYEDEYLLVINKKSGVVVHPAIGNYNNTLVNGLLYYFNNDNPNNLIRPGIVHRLDKDTSGLMLVAKTEKVHDLLAEMIKNKEVERVYVALVWGVIKHDKGTIDAPIGRDNYDRQKYTVTNINSKNAITHFRVLEKYHDTTLIECKLDTGRTHQIRVHLNYINHSIVNDLVYGNKKIINLSFGQMLHSKYIKFKHPVTKKELTFEVNPPLEFIKIIEQFKD